MELRKTVYIFFGMIATGKSYLAMAWAERKGCHYVNSDVVRKELAGLIEGEKSRVAFGEGIYTARFTRQTYDEMIRRAENALAEDLPQCIVLDASFQSIEERDRIRERLDGKCRLFFIFCYCSEDTVKRRLAQRAIDPHAISDGRWEIFLLQKDRFMPPVELSKDQIIRLDTDKSLEELLVILDQSFQA